MPFYCKYIDIFNFCLLLKFFILILAILICFNKI